MRSTITTITAYIQEQPTEIQPRLEELRTWIQEVAPEAEEKISWAMPTFYYYGNLVHFAVHKSHIGFYPGEDGVAQFTSQLDTYKHSKGAIQFPNHKPLPKALIQEITRFRYHQNQQLHMEKKKR